MDKPPLLTDDEVKEDLSKYDIPWVFIDEDKIPAIVEQMGNIIAVTRLVQRDADYENMEQQYLKEIEGIFEYIEEMFPELKESYWENRRWIQFKKEQLNPNT